MMKKTLYILLLYSLALFAAPEQQNTRINKVTFTGLDKISEKQAKEWSGLTEKTLFKESTLQKQCLDLLKGYASAGYAFTSIDSLVYILNNDSTEVNLHVYISEGHKTTTGKMTITGVDSIRSEEIMSRFIFRSGKILDPVVINNDLDDALTGFEKQGYPFSRFDLSAITIDSAKNGDTFNFTFNAIAGPQLVIKEIVILGNEITRDKVILRELGVKPGQIYNYNRVARIRPKLLKLGYFEQVYEPDVYLADKNEGGLIVEVKEGTASKFDGVLGYNPGTDKEKGYMTGLVDISLGNLFGSGRSLQVHWQKRDRESQDLMFHYKEPWVAGFPLTVGFGFQQLIQDTTFIQRDLSIDFSLPLYESFTALATLSRNETSPDSLGSYLLGIPKSRTLNASFGIMYDTRDDPLNPTDGVYYETRFQSGLKTNLGPEDLMQELELRDKVDNKRLSLDVEYYEKLFKRQVLAAAMHGRQIRSNEQYIPISDLYRMGGARSLRGFREDQFLGSSTAWFNLEYRYILGRRSRAFIFMDSGYFYLENKSGILEDYKMGYGAGIRLETGLGIMGIDYGIGRGEGDGLFNGKIHVGIVNEF